ncbi:uncharacterized protein LOC142918221 [Petromyzon marinus]|uniref:uncharacterized protein LOC142918221 n=1 Tax=Petromyzon marinus TaxID=7757 RepID=UPI003F6FBD57
MDNLNTWKVRVDTELDKKEEAVSETLETIDTLQKSTRETQLENEDVSVQLQDVINVKRGSTEKIRATGEMCDDLKCQASSLQQTFTRAEAEKENTEYVNLSRKQETKTFAVTLGDLNLKTQNNKNVTLDKVEVAVEEMGRAQWDFTIKLTIKESQATFQHDLSKHRKKLIPSVLKEIAVRKLKAHFRFKTRRAVLQWRSESTLQARRSSNNRVTSRNTNIGT